VVGVFSPAIESTQPTGTTLLPTRTLFLHDDPARVFDMEKLIWTSRLKLTLLETLDEGTKDLEWAHQIRCDEKATQWRLDFVEKN
jgi:hypothetical protein